MFGMKTSQLADTVDEARDALSAAGASPPQILMLLGTGSRTLAGSLQSRRSIDLGSIGVLPDAWREQELFSGTLAGARVWMLEDSPLDPLDERATSPDWVRPLPVWLAAASGATVCVHTSAGITLNPDSLAVGSIALVKDHLNLSGRSPLRGIGESRLGPLFPDQSRVHHPGLRSRARRAGQERGIATHEAVVACTMGPNQTTPAELQWCASTGADIVVQELAAPLIACAHAGLATLSLVAITDSGSEPLRLQEIVERSEAAAPALEDLVLACAGDFKEVADELEEVL